MRTPRFWQKRNFISTLLLPVSGIYALVAAFDRRFTRVIRTKLPVISVGNVTAGGAGKTPVTQALIPLLRRLGHAPHVVSRGYGGAKQIAHRVHPDDSWREVGDEPMLLSREAPTWVGPLRIYSIRAAKRAGASVIVADDAMQHHLLYKDISLLVIDGDYGIGNGRLIPAGPLRESFAGALERCDAVVLIGEDRHQLIRRVSKPILRGAFVPVGDVAWLRGTNVQAFAGIAHPKKFYTSLRHLGAVLVGTQDFPDHHPYTRAEIEALLARAAKHNAVLVTTAKDAVKIPPDLRTKVRVLEVALRWQDPAAVLQWLHMKLQPFARAAT